MAIHVRVWTGSGTARVTDMTNAGKRGKKCSVLCVHGVASSYHWSGPAEKMAASYTDNLVRLADEFDRAERFEDLQVLMFRLMVAARSDGVPEGLLKLHEEEVRGVDAPKEPLTAGIPGVWSGGADEGGVSLSALNDVNEWREVSHRMTDARAYDLAKKVWGKVKEAASCHEAASILRDGGVRLHGWCGMD